MLLGDVGYLGKTIPLMLAPRTGRGIRINRVRLYADDDIDPSSDSYWSLSLGTLDDNGTFTGQRTLTLASSGVRAIGVVWDVVPVLGFKAGDVVALRCTPTGQPGPLYGLRALVEVNDAR